MPVRYVIHAADDRINTTCSGAVTFDEVIAHFSELAADPAFRPGLDVLLDLTPQTSVPTSDQLLGVVSAMQSMGPSQPFGACAVVTGREVIFGMSRVLEVYARELFASFHVFRSAAEAELWLQAEAAARGSQR